MPAADSTLKVPVDVEHGVDGGDAGSPSAEAAITPESPPPTPPPAEAEARPVAAMRNLYTAALSYNGYTITDGALRLIVLLHAADLGYVYSSMMVLGVVGSRG